MQMVGDAGWQLSQGEKSRIFLGRALLQNADIIVADALVSALDPETTQAVMEFLLKRSEALVFVGPGP